MNIIWILLGLGAAFALFKGAGATDVSKEAPADANSLLATVLSPSLIDPVSLGQMMNVFIASAANQQPGNRRTRLLMYALATGLKRAMLLKGAQPNPLELLAIAYAPASWKETDALDPVKSDVARALKDALADTMTSIPALQTYLAAIAQVANSSTLPVETKARLIAYSLAIKAKQIMLMNGATFGTGVYHGVANMPTGKEFGRYLANLNNSEGSSILVYPVQS